MRLSLTLLRYSAGLAVRGGSSAMRGEGRAVQSRPVRRVEKIIIRATSKHPAIQGGLAESFADLNLREDVVSALSNIGMSQPTIIQLLATPKILMGRNIMCAAETGSGKTLAYLAPLVSRLKDEEEHHGIVPRLRRPRALILLPSRDLANQVLSVAKSLCHVAKFRAIGLIGGTKRKFIKEAVTKSIDVAVATPDSLFKFMRTDRISLSDLSHLVIDEADTLFDQSFEEVTTRIFQDINVRSGKPPLPPAMAEGTQVTVVGATLSSRMLKKIEDLVPKIKKVSSKHLHQVLPHVEQRFYKLRQEDKAEKLLSILRAYPTDVFIVFCNTVPSCDWTAYYLQSNNVPVVKLHAGFSSQDRKNLLKKFATGEGCRVLVCTDIASRGIDLTQVTHVVLFDFPNSLADYLHRVGRTGRVGCSRKCRVTSFMTHRRDIRMAWKLKDSADRHIAIMNSRVNRQLQRLEQGVLARTRT